MPIPKPRSRENRGDFMDRCISELSGIDPNTPRDQIVAICADAWKKRNNTFYNNTMEEKKYIKGLVTKTNDAGIEVAVASEESEDRDGDTIPIDGWDLGNFKKNPVLLDMHLADRSSLSVIGKVNNIRKSGKQLLFNPEFAIDENPRAKIIHDLYKGGFMRAFSVGFRAFKNKTGKIVTELLEISTVPVPAHQDALAVMKSLDIEPKEWKELFGEEDTKNLVNEKLPTLDKLTRKSSYARLKRKRNYLNKLQ